jgi:hypothetical protein
MKKTEPGNKNILMWDSPGFGDNKGITQILINTYLLNRLFSLQQKVKLIFTINYDDIKTTQRGQRFINIVDTLTSMLKYFHNYE